MHTGPPHQLGLACSTISSDGVNFTGSYGPTPAPFGIVANPAPAAVATLVLTIMPPSPARNVGKLPHGAASLNSNVESSITVMSAMFARNGALDDRNAGSPMR